jgi:polar amino acid transport system substrate-binding protein
VTISIRAAFLLVAALFAACAPGALPTLTPDTLTIGTDQPVYQPWYVDDTPENGQGFESAVAYAIAGELGYARDRVAWTRVPFNAAIQPGPKPFDVNLTEFSITEERRQAVDFSAPYYDVKQAVVALADNRFANAATLAELEARLGAQVGTTSLDAIGASIDPTTQPAVFNTNDDAKLALSNGQVEAIVVDLPTAFYITLAELENGKIVGQLPATGTPEQFGAVLDKGSALTGCVSEAVERLRSAGTLAALEQQWLTSAGSAPDLR